MTDNLETKWDKEQILQSLRNGVCKIIFTKVNGDKRIMHCTLSEQLLPEQTDIEEAIQKKKPNPEVLAVWDTDAGGWRSFRWDALEEFTTEFNL